MVQSGEMGETGERSEICEIVAGNRLIPSLELRTSALEGRMFAIPPPLDSRGPKRVEGLEITSARDLAELASLVLDQAPQSTPHFSSKASASS